MKHLLWGLFAVFIYFAAITPAQALFVSPDRLVIDDGQRSAEIVVSNRGDKPVVIRFEWERRAMTPDGKLSLLAEDETAPGYKPADPYIRFSPRQVILQPRQHQKIRVLIRRTGDMEPGEYHSHFLIKEEPIKTALEGAGAVQPKKNLSGVIELLVYRSLPVFLRQGETDINMTLNEAYIYMKDGRPFLHVDLTNQSTRSVYAQPRLTCKKPNGETYVADLIKLRLYHTWHDVKEDVLIAKKFQNDWSACTSLSVALIDKLDFEYKNNPIVTAPVSVR